MYKCFKRAEPTFPQTTLHPLSFLKNFSLKGYLKYLCIILNSFSAAANGAGRYLSLVYMMYTTFCLISICLRQYIMKATVPRRNLRVKQVFPITNSRRV